MINSTSILTNVKSFSDTQRALDELKKKLEQLDEKQNPTPTGEESDLDGEVGSVRVIQNSDNENLFEIKTQDGWKRPVVGNTPVTFKKPEEASKTQTKKSIDELETSDTSTGGTEAQKTIYDEKADKFILARPDYDSGWATWVRDDHAVVSSPGSREPLRFEHNLGAVPSLVTAYYAPDQTLDAVTWFTPIDNQAGENYNNGIGIYVDNTTAYLYGADSHSLAGMIAPTSSNLTTRAVFSDGSVRVLLWK